jgi:hypothetical protein
MSNQVKIAAAVRESLATDFRNKVNAARFPIESLSGQFALQCCSQGSAHESTSEAFGFLPISLARFTSDHVASNPNAASGVQH